MRTSLTTGTTLGWDRVSSAVGKPSRDGFDGLQRPLDLGAPREHDSTLEAVRMLTPRTISGATTFWLF